MRLNTTKAQTLELVRNAHGALTIHEAANHLDLHFCSARSRLKQLVSLNLVVCTPPGDFGAKAWTYALTPEGEAAYHSIRDGVTVRASPHPKGAKGNFQMVVSRASSIFDVGVRMAQTL